MNNNNNNNNKQNRPIPALIEQMLESYTAKGTPQHVKDNYYNVLRNIVDAIQEAFSKQQLISTMQMGFRTKLSKKGSVRHNE